MEHISDMEAFHQLTARDGDARHELCRTMLWWPTARDDDTRHELCKTVLWWPTARDDDTSRVVQDRAVVADCSWRWHTSRVVQVRVVVADCSWQWHTSRIVRTVLWWPTARDDDTRHELSRTVLWWLTARDDDTRHELCWQCQSARDDGPRHELFITRWCEAYYTVLAVPAISTRPPWVTECQAVQVRAIRAESLDHVACRWVKFVPTRSAETQIFITSWQRFLHFQKRKHFLLQYLCI